MFYRFDVSWSFFRVLSILLCLKCSRDSKGPWGFYGIKKLLGGYQFSSGRQTILKVPLGFSTFANLRNP